ncbi:MAG: DNA gyrase subunit A, partial [Beggiatoa sp.]|nr:DNA gyrase subunit A [Beggiatoa sp.]
GLKPVHRRVLYAMRELGNDWNKPYKKSARVVGDVIGKYHPHGDVAIYDTIVRMAQPFSLRYMLIDGQGNFGSVDGDAPAAMRYTEVRMSRIAHELLADLDEETVDFGPNYDGSETEPSILPTRIPNLLINGSTGIAVGMATNIPPHNLCEVMDACLALCERPELTVPALCELIPGPDFPTAGIIHGIAGIREAYATGRGRIYLRARTAFENEGERIVVSELPYQVNKAKLQERIAERTLNLKEILECFLRHRREVVTRRTLYQLRKARDRAHVLEGLAVALANIDPIIGLIKASTSPAEAKRGLMEYVWAPGVVVEMLERAGAESSRPRDLPEQYGLSPEGYHLSEVEVQAILDLRLQRLTALEQDKIIEEYQSLLKQIQDLLDILRLPERLMEVIRGELTAARDQFSDARRTEIRTDAADLRLEDLISEEDVVVTLSHEGYAKAQPLDQYRSQRRGGKGKTATTMKEEDFIEKLFVANTHDTILCFSSLGRLYWLKVYELPQAGRTARGKPMVNLLPLAEGERITAILPIKSFEQEGFVLMATRQGVVKKCPLAEFSRPRASGIIAIDLPDGDRLVGVALTDGEQDVMLFSSTGKAVRFREGEVRAMGRAARGVRGLRLAEGETVIALIIVVPGTHILCATEHGYGKRTRIEDYPRHGRGGQGVIAIQTTARNGLLVGAIAVRDEDEVMLVSNRGMLVRTP